jgi:hypothetical protein
MNQREKAKVIRRTNKLVQASTELAGFRDRITAILDQLEKEEFSREKTADECISIGMRIQSISKILRPLSIEGQAKQHWKQKLQPIFVKEIRENYRNKKWMKKYAKKYGELSPTKAWFEEHENNG